MKIRFTLFVIIFFGATKLYAQFADNNVTSTLLSAFSERAYSSEPVTDQQLDLILKCGIKAPSAHNNQPWKFTVIKDETIMREIIDNTVPGNVLIVISGIESESGATPD
ncbi:MAG TPA: nitroreductase family protein, partial [Bacteroidales bacterium]|nr:nitroreductase family protein [Bacteroidales bacterium]